jgi:hypothetical protein
VERSLFVGLLQGIRKTAALHAPAHRLKVGIGLSSMELLIADCPSLLETLDLLLELVDGGQLQSICLIKCRPEQ